MEKIIGRYKFEAVEGFVRLTCNDGRFSRIQCAWGRSAVRATKKFENLEGEALRVWLTQMSCNGFPR